MQQRQNLATITTKALDGLYQVINELKPNIVLVHGDTSTTFVGALQHSIIKFQWVTLKQVCTYDKYSPYPEEMNRVLTGNIAKIHFAPTIKNKQNLVKENITEGII